MNWKLILIGAISGFLAAAKTDLDAYRAQSTPENAFNWKTALERWAQGAVFGAAGAAGIDVAAGGAAHAS